MGAAMLPAGVRSTSPEKELDGPAFEGFTDDFTDGFLFIMVANCFRMLPIMFLSGLSPSVICDGADVNDVAKDVPISDLREATDLTAVRRFSMMGPIGLILFMYDG